MTIGTPTPDQRQDALELIVARQGDPSTACAYLGTQREGVIAELEDLDPPWTQTLRVALDEASRVVGAVVVDWDADETGRSWIQGPWTVDERAWAEHAGALVEAAVALTPRGVTRHELCAAPAHTGLASLATSRLGWRATEVSIAYVARADTGWPQACPQVRRAARADLEALGALHEECFPDTYATAKQLLEGEERTTVVIEREGVLAGYASGQVQPDGSGYLDYLAVARTHRGQGLATSLLGVVGRDLLARAPKGDVNLTVVDSNAPAIALYERFGLVRDAELVGYRSWEVSGEQA